MVNLIEIDISILKTMIGGELPSFWVKTLMAIPASDEIQLILVPHDKSSAEPFPGLTAAINQEIDKGAYSCITGALSDTDSRVINVRTVTDMVSTHEEDDQ